MIAAWPTSSIRPPRPPYSSAMSAERSKTGQPWCGLPEQVGDPHQRGDQPGQPRPAGPQRGPQLRIERARDQDPAEQADASACLLLRPIPATTPATSHSRGRSVEHAPGSTRTSTAVQARVSKVAVDSRWPSAMTTADAADDDGGQHLAAAAPPEQPRELHRQQHDADDRQHAAAAAAPQVVRRDLGGEPREQRRERRLVGVAPRQPLTGRDEVELVAVRSVERRHRQQYGGLHRDDDADLAPREGRALLGHARILSRSLSTVRVVEAEPVAQVAVAGRRTARSTAS